MRLFGSHPSSVAWLFLVPRSARTVFYQCSASPSTLHSTTTPSNQSRRMSSSTTSTTGSSVILSTLSSSEKLDPENPENRDLEPQSIPSRGEAPVESADGPSVVAATVAASDHGSSTSSSSDGVPLLPPPDPNRSDNEIPKIQLGDTISFEELGPVIINADGTTRRIDNWDQMTDAEQKVAWRRISQRNEERRRKLLLQQQQDTESNTDSVN